LEKNNTVSHKKEIINSRLSVYYSNKDKAVSTFAEDVRQGLMSANKYLLPKYFYDDKGSELFEKICVTPEYYVTRTESFILKKYADEIAKFNENRAILEELGSGSSVKTRLLISSYIKKAKALHYVPIDVSEIMISSSEKLIEEYNGLNITGIIADYMEGIELASYLFTEPKLILFLGSSIGNFDLFHAEQFVKFISSKMNYGDSLLIGFDMVKEIAVLNAAYNDKEGVTADFNMNLLARMNNELDANFDLNNFRHFSFFNQDKMHLVSLKEQQVKINAIDSGINFSQGERIHTENSYKFTKEMISEIAAYSELEFSKMWTDDKKYFSLCLFSKM
jgi:dimethylhistidine N-methyltransferase